MTTEQDVDVVQVNEYNECVDRRPPCRPLDSSLIFLGTASMKPSPSRNVSATALKIGNEICIIDCGEGTQHQIVKLTAKSHAQRNHRRQRMGTGDGGGGGNGDISAITTIAPGTITRIFITHLHGDHCFGVPGLLCLIDDNSHKTPPPPSSSRDQGSTSPLSPSSSKVVQVVGPKGLRNMLRAALISSATNFSFQIRIDELIFNDHQREDIPEETKVSANGISTSRLRHFCTVFEVPPHASEIPGVDVVVRLSDGTWALPCHPNGGQVASSWTMYAAPLVHSIESVGYVFCEHPHQGTFNKTKLQSVKQQLLTDENRLYQQQTYGFQNPLALLGKLQKGQQVTIRNSDNQMQTLYPKDYMLPSTPGRKVVVLGDTCDSRQIARLAANADIVVHEATNAAIEDDETVEGVLRTAVSRGHSTPGMAGMFAKCCRARLLVLTHFSSRYKDDDSPESREVMHKIVSEAQLAAGHDNVIAARDLMQIPVAIHRQQQAGNGCIVEAAAINVNPDVAAKEAAAAADSFLKVAEVWG